MSFSCISPSPLDLSKVRREDTVTSLLPFIKTPKKIIMTAASLIIAGSGNVSTQLSVNVKLKSYLSCLLTKIEIGKQRWRVTVRLLMTYNIL